MATAIHTHGSLHAMTAANRKNQPDGQSPAHTNSMQKINKSQFRTCKLQKHSPGTGTETCKQAGEGSCRKFEAKQHTSQPAYQAGSQEAQSTRQIGTCRQPGQQPTNKKTRSEQARQQTSEPASMPAKQPRHHPASQPTKQPASQTQAKTIKTERQRGTQKQQHTQPSRGFTGPIAS